MQQILWVLQETQRLKGFSSVLDLGMFTMNILQKFLWKSILVAACLLEEFSVLESVCGCRLFRDSPDVISNSGAGNLDAGALAGEGELMNLGRLMSAPMLDVTGGNVCGDAGLGFTDFRSV